MSSTSSQPASGQNYHSGGGGGVLLNSLEYSAERIQNPSLVSGDESGGSALSSEAGDASDGFATEEDDDEDDDEALTEAQKKEAGARAEQRQSDLRRQIVAIQQDSAIAPQDKAKRIQELMTSQWSSRQRRPSNRSAIASNKLEDKMTDFGIVTAADQIVSYHDKESKIIGCKHYQRACKLQAHCCGKWYPCRFCHDEVSDHNIIRNLTVTMMCMFCLTVQPAGQECINQECGKNVSKYYCKECKLWDNDPRKNIYHCYDCGICRIGKGLGQDYFHCKKCNVCMAISLRGKHKCIERNLESDCPICGEYMFTSTTTVIFMPCGHCIHYKCHQEYIQTSYQCPTCFKSLANMSEYFRRIDAMLAQHTMPPEYTNSYTFIYCNDCEKKCYAKFHFLYHKCVCCKGYNTKILQTLEVKEGVTLDKLNELFLPAPTAPPAVGGGTASVLDRSDAVGELLRSASVQSIRHISSATPGFSTSNISVLSAASLTDAEISASMNAAMGRRSSNADMDVARRSRRNSRSSDMDATIP